MQPHQQPQAPASQQQPLQQINVANVQARAIFIVALKKKCLHFAC